MRRAAMVTMVFFVVATALTVAVLALTGCGTDPAARNAETMLGEAASTSATDESTDATQPATMETKPTDSADRPVLQQLPRLSPADLAFVSIRSGTAGETWSLLLGPAGQADELATLLAAYDRILLQPEKGRPAGQNSNVDLGQFLEIHFSLRNCGEVLVLIEPPGPDFVVRLDPGLGDAQSPPTAVADATSLAETVRELLAPDGSTTLRTQTSALSAAMPADFGFVLAYGIYARNVLDTFGGTFTKDLISRSQPTATADLRLTQAELADVYRTLRDIDIMAYPLGFDPAPASTPGVGTLFVTPHPSYYLMIRAGGQEHVVRWEDAHQSDAPQAMKLRGLIQRIQQMIEAKSEYKALPLPRGGYA